MYDLGVSISIDRNDCNELVNTLRRIFNNTEKYDGEDFTIYQAITGEVGFTIPIGRIHAEEFETSMDGQTLVKPVIRKEMEKILIDSVKNNEINWYEIGSEVLVWFALTTGTRYSTKDIKIETLVYRYGCIIYSRLVIYFVSDDVCWVPRELAISPSKIM